MNVPEIKPIQTIEYESKQSKYEQCGKLPIRSIILGPSGSGKTVLLVNMILDIYKKCFNRVYVFPPAFALIPLGSPSNSILNSTTCVERMRIACLTTMILKT